MDAFNQMLQNLVTIFVVGALIMYGVQLLLRAAGRSFSDSGPRLGPGRLGRNSVDAPAVRFPYRRSGDLLTPTEARFLQALDAAVGGSHRIFGKVRLADIVDVRPGISGGAWRTAFNRVALKHVDFVVCDGDTFRVVATVELDDRSHQAPHRQKRDDFVDRALAAAGVRLVRVPVTSAYDSAALRRRVLGLAGDEVAAMRASPSSLTQPGHSSSAELTEQGVAPRCPSCGSGMNRRFALRGAGRQEYFICDRAPTCSGRVSAR